MHLYEAGIFSLIFWWVVIVSAVVISLVVTASRKVVRQWKGRQMKSDR